MRTSGGGEPLDSRFRQRVYEIVRLVPYGQVTTYGYVALLCGMPRRARHVGWALHTLPDDLVWGRDDDERRGDRERPREHRPGRIAAAREATLGRVPWHRVINAQARVSTHPDEAGTRRQIDLLREEGIRVADDGTLVEGLAAHRWQPAPAVVDDLELPAEVLFELDRERPD
ncbi:MAG: MGMT family protein [Chloroflexota bacterium]